MIFRAGRRKKLRPRYCLSTFIIGYKNGLESSETGMQAHGNIVAPLRSRESAPPAFDGGNVVLVCTIPSRSEDTSKDPKSAVSQSLCCIVDTLSSKPVFLRIPKRFCE